MKNGDQPAIPPQFDPMEHTRGQMPRGLTKREMFAMAAMQGMLSKRFDSPGEDLEGTCLSAVEYADELLSQLEK